MLKDERLAEKLRPWIQLHHISGAGPKTKHALLRRFHTPDGVLDSGQLQLTQSSRKSRHYLPDIDRDLDWANHPNHHILTFADPRFPKLLKQIADPPLLLYVRGDADALNAPQVSIVGSRNATPYGRRIAMALASGLAGCGITVTSGLALGIDAAAHQGAIDGRGNTIAVAAHGLNEVYPRRHRKLALQVSRCGALVSEFAVGTAPRREHFPQRNRIISGLSLGTIVVEANRRSGSLITARLAAEQNRDVFAIPGPVYSPQSWGCHELIRQGATLVERLEHVLEELPFNHRPKNISHDQPELESGPCKGLLAHMGYEPVTVDILVARSGLTTDSVCSMLLQMEINGWVESFAGGAYVQVPKTKR
jgi:DNA processing protein